jgi:hypothetical protein
MKKVFGLQNENETSSITKIYFLLKVIIDAAVYSEYAIVI